MDHFNLYEWLSAAAHAALATFAGLLGYTTRQQHQGAPFNIWHAVTEALSSGLVGFLVMLLCQAMQVDLLWTGFLVGIFGWLGANASIRMLERIAYGKFGLTPNGKAGADPTDKDGAA